MLHVMVSDDSQGIGPTSNVVDGASTMSALDVGIEFHFLNGTLYFFMDVFQKVRYLI